MDKVRCEWANCHPLAVKYHDEEWGDPLHDDQKHFEFILLEVMQCGLSWLTILKKRDSLRKAFDNFDFEIISNYDNEKIESLLSDTSIIRSIKKINAVINNAKKFIEIRKEFGSFDKYIWSFTDNSTVLIPSHGEGNIPTKTDLSDKISLDMKKRGFKFLGSITIYSHLQAAGIVNDHLNYCYKY